MGPLTGSAQESHPALGRPAVGLPATALAPPETPACGRGAESSVRLATTAIVVRPPATRPPASKTATAAPPAVSALAANQPEDVPPHTHGQSSLLALGSPISARRSVLGVHHFDASDAPMVPLEIGLIGLDHLGERRNARRSAPPRHSRGYRGPTLMVRSLGRLPPPAAITGEP